MHELSLAENIINTILENDGVTPYNLLSIKISCGPLSGVNTASLEFGIKMITEQSGMGNIKVNIEESPAKLECECGHVFDNESVFCTCPYCNSKNHKVLDGDELNIDSVEVQDDKKN